MKFLLLFGLMCILVPGTVQDPCTNYITDRQGNRRTTYTARGTEPKICDSHLVKEEGKWYRFQFRYPSKMASECVRGLKCGTERPIWMRGEPPTALDPGPKEVEVCSANDADCCGHWNSTILVKFCRVTTEEHDDVYYVYQLKKPPGCDMAYCIINAAVCPRGTVFHQDSYTCKAAPKRLGLSLMLDKDRNKDPCDIYLFETEDKRSLMFEAEDDDSFICDVDVIDDESTWYRLQVHNSSRMINECVRGPKCGTEKPIWMKGDHPTALSPGPKEVTVCSASNDDCCTGWNSTIQAKFCRATEDDDEDFYVYQLKRPPGCEMAYCVGMSTTACSYNQRYNPLVKKCITINSDADVCPLMTDPVLEGPVFDDDKSDFYFTCKIIRNNSEIPGYKREWERYRVRFFFAGKMDNMQESITDSFNLVVKIWYSRMRDQVGKTILCEVQAYWRNMGKIGCARDWEAQEKKCIGPLSSRGVMSLVNGKCVPIPASRTAAITPSTTITTDHVSAAPSGMSHNVPSTIQTIQDPCTDYITDTQENRRLDYSAKDAEPYICDTNLIEEEGKWYRFRVHYSSKMTNECVRGPKCGTERPIWMKGEHPTATARGPTRVTVCSANDDDCCGHWNSTILAKFCRATLEEHVDDYYVYQLKKPPRCAMAYCIVNATVCPQSTVFNKESYTCETIDPHVEERPKGNGQRASAYSYGIVVAILGSIAFRYNFC